MSKAKQIVLDRSEYVSLDTMFDQCDFDGVRQYLGVLEKVLKSGEDGKFRVEWSYESTDVYLDVYREETDKEYTLRLAKEEREREKRRLAKEKKLERARAALAETEELERAEYERLRAKFGG